jgi:pimeloyl-ACP methyl ester carboxylesterase
MSLLASACSSSPDTPAFFEAFERLPVKTVQIQGHRIAYLDHGQGSPVILIHGLGGSLWQWEQQQAALSSAHRLITLDLLGSGLSDKPDIDYTPEVMLTSLREFMDALHLPRASLVGNSLGAGLAIGMALTYPDRVDRLILISGLPDHVHDKTSSPMLRRGIEGWVPEWVIRFGNVLTGRSATRRILKEIVYDHSLLTPAVIERSYRNRSRPGIIHPIVSLMRNLHLWEAGFARQLHEVHHPTLIVWGSQDRLFPPQVGRDLQAVIAGSSFALIPDAGHIPQWERPAAVNSVLLNFLQP